MIEKRGRLNEEDLDRFFAAGFSARTTSMR
jgi:hypothetical protein